MSLAPSSSYSSGGMLLDGEDLLMLEESFRIGEGAEDDGMDFELEPLPLDCEPETVPSAAAERRASSMWHHSAPCNLLAGSSSSASSSAGAKAGSLLNNGSSSAFSSEAADSAEDLLAAAQRQWAPRDGAVGSLVPHNLPQKYRKQPCRAQQQLKQSKSFSFSPGADIDPFGSAPNTEQRSSFSKPNTTQAQHALPHPGQPSEEELIQRLAASMRRSGETRSRLFLGGSSSSSNSNKRSQQQRTSAPSAVLSGQIRELQHKEAPQQPQTPNSIAAVTTSSSAAAHVAPSQSILRLSGFLSGDLKTLTSGLEKSRDMVRRHGSLVMGRTMMNGTPSSVAGM